MAYWISVINDRAVTEVPLKASVSNFQIIPCEQYPLPNADKAITGDKVDEWDGVYNNGMISSIEAGNKIFHYELYMIYPLCA